MLPCSSPESSLLPRDSFPTEACPCWPGRPLLLPSPCSLQGPRLAVHSAGRGGCGALWPRGEPALAMLVRVPSRASWMGIAAAEPLFHLPLMAQQPKMGLGRSKGSLLWHKRQGRPALDPGHGLGPLSSLTSLCLLAPHSLSWHCRALVSPWSPQVHLCLWDTPPWIVTQCMRHHSLPPQAYMLCLEIA